jgi:HK97 gp10 family phage protein
MGITIDGISSTKKTLDEYVEKIGRKQTVALVTCGMNIMNQMKSIMKNATEESVSGEPPRIQTGVLKNSIIYELQRPDNGEFSILVGPGGPANEYAAKQEFGSSTNWPHPYARPSLAMKRDDCIRIISASVENTSKEV